MDEIEEAKGVGAHGQWERVWRSPEMFARLGAQRHECPQCGVVHWTKQPTSSERVRDWRERRKKEAEE